MGLLVFVMSQRHKLQKTKTSFYCDVTSFLLKRTENVLVSYPLSSLETIETTLGTCLAQSQDSPAQLSSEENIPLNLWVFYIKPDATADNGQLTFISQVAPRRKPLPDLYV